MKELERLKLQVKIMANTIDTQEKIIEYLRRLLPQTDIIKSGFWKEIKYLPNTEYYQPLLNLMSEHNLTLLEGEMDEIIDCVLKMVESSKTKLTSERNGARPFINEILTKTMEKK